MKNKGCWICTQCNINFSHKGSLKRHIISKHHNDSSKFFECYRCSETFRRKDQLHRHTHKVHSCCQLLPRFERCAYCSIKSQSKISDLENVTCSVLNVTETASCSKLQKKKDNFICADCTQIYTRKNDLRRHIEAKHLKRNFFGCAVCGEKYSRKDSLSKHLKTKHPSGESELFVCAECDKQFLWKGNLITHLKRHACKPVISKKSTESSFKCLECHRNLPSRNTIIQHYQEAHKISITVRILSFSSMREFDEWRKNMQSQTITQFRKRNRYKTSDKMVSIYVCCRTGLYRSAVKEEERKRSLRNCGYKGIGGYCPAQIMVSEFSDKCLVQFCETHLGHDVGNEVELKYFYLEKDERLKMAAKIKDGVPLTQIVKKEISSNTLNDKKSRLSLLSRKDLHNIATAYKIGSKNCQRLKFTDDIISTEDFVAKHREAILFYKKEGEEDNDYRVFHRHDFVLIIMNKMQEKNLLIYGNKIVAMDGTHGTGPHDFILHSLLVMNVDCEGIPVAFALSNKNDETLIDVFLTCVRNRVGVVAPKIFMSDMQHNYNNSWVRIMNVAEHDLFCIWRVQEAWQKHLHSIKNKEKRATVRERLYKLLHELNPVVFDELLNSFLSISDEETKKFVEYFRDKYSKTVPLWARCYRQFYGINTNMHLEIFNRILKRKVAGGQKIKTMYQALVYYYEYLEQRNSHNDKNIIFGTIKNNLTRLKERHEEATELFECVKEKSIDITPIDDQMFLINSLNDRDLYTVSKMDQKECSLYGEDVVCRLHCASCNVCFHEYKCSCHDYAISNNMCKHIHVIGMYLRNCSDKSDDTVNDLNSNETMVENIDSTSHLMADNSCDMDLMNVDAYTSDDKLETAKQCAVEEFRELLQSVDSMEDVKYITETVVESIRNYLMTKKQ